MGNHASREVTNGMNIVNSFAVNAIVRNSQRSSGSVTGRQVQKNVIEEGCVVQNTKFQQLANVDMTLVAEINVEQQNKIASEIANDIKTQLKNQEDGIVKGIATALNPGGSSNNKISNLTTIENEIEALFSIDTLQNLIAATQIDQLQENVCKGQVYGAEFVQDFKAKVFTHMKSNSKQYNDFVNKTITNAAANLTTDEGSDIGKFLRNWSPGGIIEQLNNNPGGGGPSKNMMLISASSCSSICCLGLLALLGVAYKKRLI
jgi:hypothetical protein